MSFSFVLYLLVIAGSIASSYATSNNETKCKEDEYYDHGVNNCEPCSDFCPYTSWPAYEKLCEEHCPIVYRQMMDKAQKPEVELVPGASSQTSRKSSSSASATDKAVIGGIIGSVAGIALIVAVVVVVVRRVQQKRGGRRNGVQAQTENRTQGGYRYTPTGVQEENNEQAASERLSQNEGLLTVFCRRGEQETSSGRRGRQEIALLGSSNGSGIQETFLSQSSPIYKPSRSGMTTTHV